MALDIKSVYTSCACNRSAFALDWGYNGLICYGANNAVILYDVKANEGAGEVVDVLVYHKAPVYCVRWIKKEPHVPEDELISVSVDKTAVVWHKVENSFIFECCLLNHTATVMVASGIYYLQQRDQYQNAFFATASADSTVTVWERNKNVVRVFQTISLGRGFALDLKFSFLPATKEPVPLLAMAADDCKIYLYVQGEDNKFCKVLTLIGHEDWVRGISFALNDKGDLLLASCSQDCFVRMWKISPHCTEPITENNNIDVKEIKLKETLFMAATPARSYTFSIMLESLMSGHENWVYSICWEPPYLEDGDLKQPMRLLTASMDKTMIIWEYNESSELWVEKVRVGEVGGNTLGFYGGVYAPDGKSILAHGYQGAFHLWQYKEDLSKWEPGVIVGGHFDEVADIAWDPKGNYLLSCSTDQTTRLHAPWIVDSDSKKIAWHEIGRPQIHGYDMNSLAVINRCKFASAADEKVLRVFEAPQNFVDNFKNICAIDLCPTEGTKIPEGASVPALGLSNKAVFEKDLMISAESEKDKQQKYANEYPDFYFSPINLTAPPTEDVLLQNTLWPEIQKLYGHGYEVYSIAANHAGTIVASSCKASKAEHADIVLWNTCTWKQIERLNSHTLTITQMVFSPDDQRLLSVSRDRTWSIFEMIHGEASTHFIRVAYSDKKNGIHTRIIWTCAWTHDGKYFSTGSRDKKVVLWGKYEKKENQNESTLGLYYPCLPVLELEESCTAIDFAPCFLQDRYLAAVGLENGSILLYRWAQKHWETPDCLEMPTVINVISAHHLAVKRILFSSLHWNGTWNGNIGTTEENILQVASCGSDHFVRVYSIVLNG